MFDLWKFQTIFEKFQKFQRKVKKTSVINLIDWINFKFELILLLFKFIQWIFINFSDNSGKLSDNSPLGSVGSASEAIDELAGLSLEEQERQREEWSQVNLNVLISFLYILLIFLQLIFKELSRVEEEIQTLRTVLQSKQRHAHELKKKMGITVWREITDDVNSGLKNVKDSNVWVKFAFSIISPKYGKIFPKLN